MDSSKSTEIEQAGFIPAERKKTLSFSEKLFRRSRTAESEIRDPKPWGIRVLYSPSDAIVDLVFVHGLKGHRENTWSQGENGPPWPQTLLPRKMQNARVLTFGYDATPIAWGSGSSISGNRIGDHSKNLLTAVAASRLEGKNQPHRPIIFVAHSLGGLVCKDALLAARSSPEEHLRRVFEQTCGVLFLGTPHSGASLATVAEKTARLLGPTTSKPNLKILKVLKKDSEVLGRIQADFHALLQCRNAAGKGELPIQVTCFYEELIYPGLGDVIVSTDSAVLPGYTGIGIRAHHRNMARFASENSPGFGSVVSELQRFVNAAAYFGGSSTDSRMATISPSRVAKGVSSCGSTMMSWQGTDYADITILGNVVKSNIVHGSQTIRGDLIFSG
ncbi:hypothetical protein B0H67DRAFT_363684 [Lasiosphaeris hirsuta]|uniref:DUF676 domain-containing protein n=1 Tax=Lasiosphaeris hirsuta TaxID=260670 RepID=A0AA40DIK4_9PEZI|nr:hypothetical protein B0H67DRAFT_363684 [Lasiosphaeris hirsuta]